EQPTLSRDGKRCAYVLRELDAAEDRATRSIWCVELDGGSPRRITHGPADSAPAWSPDGTTLAFLRASDGPPQVWLLPADAGEPEQVTTWPLGAGRRVWSPDGARIAFAAPTGPEPAAAAPIVADRLDYQADGTGYIGALRKHLFVVEPATRTSRQLTRG